MISLNLPSPLAYPLTMLARRIFPPSPVANAISQDQHEYFLWQYRSTPRFDHVFWQSLDFRNAVIVDVGCGLGGRAPYFLERGARHVYCVDINTVELEKGQMILAERFPTFAANVTFAHPDDKRLAQVGNFALMIDCFEHLSDPANVLRQVSTWILPAAKIWIGSIGWYHHAASHCNNYIPIPWCHVLFSERAILRTIRRIQHDPRYVPTVWDQIDGLDRWDQVESLKDRPGEPLNMLSLRQIRHLLRRDDLILEKFQVHGYSGHGNRFSQVLSGLARVPVIQELFHSYYTAILSKRS